MLIGYMRVSSETDRQNTDLQRDALIEAGVDPKHLFKDNASGAKKDRPGLKAALAFMQKGDCLVVWKLDRLGRSLPHLLDIISRLRQHHIAFRSLTEQMDTTTPHGELLFNLFGSLAQYERALTRERILAGLKSAKRRGRIGGRPKIITDAVIEKIKKRLANGETKPAICASMQLKKSTFYGGIKRRLHTCQ